jgi:dCMP deaminase
MDQRPSKIEYYLNIAEEVAKRGTCLRRNFGAVIVNNDQIVSTGYTGSARGTNNCIDIGQCYRQEMKIPPGERYELCRSVHAEMNAIIHAKRTEMLGGTLYLVGISKETGGYVETTEPCKLCKRMIINAGLTYVFARQGVERIAKFDVDHWVANEVKEIYGGENAY